MPLRENKTPCALSLFFRLLLPRCTHLCDSAFARPQNRLTVVTELTSRGLASGMSVENTELSNSPVQSYHSEGEPSLVQAGEWENPINLASGP